LNQSLQERLERTENQASTLTSSDEIVAATKPLIYQIEQLTNEVSQYVCRLLKMLHQLQQNKFQLNGKEKLLIQRERDILSKLQMAQMQASEAIESDRKSTETVLRLEMALAQVSKLYHCAYTGTYLISW
jgi:tRNA nucleotidyltransferase/poly(A) polymerase